MRDRLDRLAQRHVDHAAGSRRPAAFVEQHRHDLPRGAVAEELAQRLFMPGDAMRLDQFEKVGGRVAAQRGLGEMRVRRQEALGHGADIGEVAPPAARNQDLFARRIGMVDDQHPPPPLPGGRGSHKPRRARAEDDRVIVLHGRGLEGIGR